MSNRNEELIRDRVAAFEQALAGLPADRGSTPLVQRWGELREALELAPAAQRRECPGCGWLAMRAAIRCGRCWIKLVPLAET